MFVYKKINFSLALRLHLGATLPSLIHLFSDPLTLGAVYDMASPAAPGLFFCFCAMMLLIFVRARNHVCPYRQLKFSYIYFFNRYLYPYQPGIAYISSVPLMEEPTIVLVCLVILERKRG